MFLFHHFLSDTEITIFFPFISITNCHQLLFYIIPFTWILFSVTENVFPLVVRFYTVT